MQKKEKTLHLPTLAEFTSNNGLQLKIYVSNITIHAINSKTLWASIANPRKRKQIATYLLLVGL